MFIFNFNTNVFACLFFFSLLQASRDLVCFLQLDHVNVYLGQDYKSKYKAPTDYCMVLKVQSHKHTGRATL